MEPKQNTTVDVFRIISELIRGLVDDPECLEIKLSEAEPGRKMIHVTAPPREFGRIIGVNGRSARAIRTLLAGLGAAQGTQFSLDVRVSE